MHNLVPLSINTAKNSPLSLETSTQKCKQAINQTATVIMLKFVVRKGSNKTNKNQMLYITQGRGRGHFLTACKEGTIKRTTGC